MKKIALFALAATSLFTHAALAGSYFPVKAGDVASFSTGGNFNGGAVAHAVKASGAVAVKIEGMPGFSGALYSPANSEKLYSVVNGRQSLIVDFAAPVGSRVTLTGADPCLKTAVISAKNQTVHTRAGKFNNAVIVDFPAATCSDSGLSMAFAPGVGLVSYTVGSIAGPREYLLDFASVGNKTFPVLDGLELKAEAIDTLDMQENRMLPVVLTVTNPRPVARAVKFATQQEVEAVILDHNGLEVDRWSENMIFGQAQKTIEIAAGASKRYTLLLDLKKGSEQTRLGFGSYTVRVQFKGKTVHVSNSLGDGMIGIPRTTLRDEGLPLAAVELPLSITSTAW